MDKIRIDLWTDIALNVLSEMISHSLQKAFLDPCTHPQYIYANSIHVYTNPSWIHVFLRFSELPLEPTQYTAGLGMV